MKDDYPKYLTMNNGELEHEINPLLTVGVTIYSVGVPVSLRSVIASDE